MQTMTLRSLFTFSSLLLVTATLAAGCKKQAPATSADNAAPADQEASSSVAPPSPEGRAPIQPAPAPIVVPENADVNATLAQLSLELRKYVVRTRSVPKTFEEFAAKSRVQVPPAPAGKKYEIQGQVVGLAKR
jgi:hypothetical protein